MSVPAAENDVVVMHCHGAVAWHVIKRPSASPLSAVAQSVEADESDLSRWLRVSQRKALDTEPYTRRLGAGLCCHRQCAGSIVWPIDRRRCSHGRPKHEAVRLRAPAAVGR
jgi:hypothetical protein